jgi:hypothetical protein
VFVHCWSLCEENGRGSAIVEIVFFFDEKCINSQVI